MTKDNDNIKNKYCLDNNIKLERIPYNLSTKNVIKIIKKLIEYERT